MGLRKCGAKRENKSLQGAGSLLGALSSPAEHDKQSWGKLKRGQPAAGSLGLHGRKERAPRRRIGGLAAPGPHRAQHSSSRSTSGYLWRPGLGFLTRVARRGDLKAGKGTRNRSSELRS